MATDLLLMFIISCHAIMAVIFVSNLLYLGRKKQTPIVKPDPFVSLLVPARNEAANLRRLIPSILDQEYKNFELIVYDDASEDETWSVIQSFDDPRIRAMQGDGPPPGWAGKVHALYQAAHSSTGEALLFLDADAVFNDADALGRIVAKYRRMPSGRVLTGLPQYKGGGLLLVSLITHSVLVSLPWFIVHKIPFSTVGALNGQCWMIDAEIYRRFEPHKRVAGEILEDVLIGRYLKKNRIAPFLADLRDELSVFMYDSFPDAWRGFRKNIFLLMGGNVFAFIPLFTLFAVVFVLPPFLEPVLLLLIYFEKFATDRKSGFPLSISLLAPLSFLLGSTLQLDSAWNHITGNIFWKGRSVISS